MDAALLAALHAGSFPRPWSEETFEVFLGDPTVAGLIAGQDGFILWRGVAGESEILTLAVATAQRRRGLAKALLGAALTRASEAGSTEMFLEVSSRNHAAVGLYRAAGFEDAGLRRGYYETDGDREDALLMRLSLTAPPPPTIS